MKRFLSALDREASNLVAAIILAMCLAFLTVALSVINVEMKSVPWLHLDGEQPQ